jgi:hypothetical protein
MQGHRISQICQIRWELDSLTIVCATQSPVQIVDSSRRHDSYQHMSWMNADCERAMVGTTLSKLMLVISK